MIGVNIDITDRKRAEAALEVSEARYHALFDDNPSMYFTLDTAGTVLSVNEFGARQLGYAPAELIGQSVLRVVHQEDWEAARRHLARCAEERETVVRTELRKIRRDGSILWVREAARSVQDPQGQTMVLIVCEDFTDLKRAEEHQNLLVAELDHRVKNVLATVAAVAKDTSEHSSSMVDFVDALNHRIRSMADAHALLSKTHWLGVSLADLVRQELAPYAAAGNTIVEGSDMWLTPAATQTMAMVLHELATNAAKYGAFSVPEGRVSVCWDLRSNGIGPQLRLQWCEDGGPAVTTPARPGYGTSVILDLIPYELGGTVKLEYTENGVNCTIEFAVQSDRDHDMPLRSEPSAKEV